MLYRKFGGRPALASLAVRVPRHLEAAYDSDWIADLHALSLCYLGNAWRVGGELRSPGDAFDAARSLRLAGTGYPSIEAEALAPPWAMMEADSYLFREDSAVKGHS